MEASIRPRSSESAAHLIILASHLLLVSLSLSLSPHALDSCVSVCVNHQPGHNLSMPWCLLIVLCPVCLLERQKRQKENPLRLHSCSLDLVLAAHTNFMEACRFSHYLTYAHLSRPFFCPPCCMRPA